MPYRKFIHPPAVILTHGGVTVYQVYEGDDLDRPVKFLFTLDPKHTSDEDLDVQDVRKLEVPGARLFVTEEPLSDQADADNRHMDIHQYRRSPYWTLNIESWERWLNIRQPALILEVLAEAIDAGKLVP
jgi:hypothetical protein